MNLSCLTPQTRRRAAMIAAIVLAALPFRVAAQETGDPAEGRHLAGEFCTNCHIITPTKQTAGANHVPTFSSVANRPSTTPATLRKSLLRPHPQISNMQATPDELRDLIAYIMSLRGK